MCGKHTSLYFCLDYKISLPSPPATFISPSLSHLWEDSPFAIDNHMPLQTKATSGTLMHEYSASSRMLTEQLLQARHCLGAKDTTPKNCCSPWFSDTI